MEGQHPLVSVIVTSYNRENYLKKTISSILSQTFKDFELIVVDNYSSFDFWTLIDSFEDSRIRAFQNANGGIIAINRNYAIERSKGRYVAFCDDDDLWHPEKLAVQIDYLSSRDHTVVGSDFNIIDQDDKFVKRVYKEKVKNRYELYRGNVVALSSVMCEMTDSVRFDESSNYLAIEDYKLWMELLHHGYDICNIPQPLMSYRVSGTNASAQDFAYPIKRIKICSYYFWHYRHPLYVWRYYLSALKSNILHIILRTKDSWIDN